MYIVSVVGFTYFHCTDAVSPFEAGPYFIAAVVFVIGYHFSHRNLAVPIAFAHDYKFNSILNSASTYTIAFK